MMLDGSHFACTVWTLTQYMMLHLQHLTMYIYICCLSGATKPEEINPGLICPVFDELLPCLPKKIRKKLHFGVRHEDVSCDILINDITPLGVLVIFIISIVSLIPYVHPQLLSVTSLCSLTKNWISTDIFHCLVST